MAKPPPPSATPPEAAATTEQDFSLVLGGPLYQLLRRSRLTNETLRPVHRRVLLAILICWAPLLALSAVQGLAIEPGRRMPFLDDVGFNLRFLVAVPLLIFAEWMVHVRIRPLVDQFRARGLVRSDQTDRFTDALSEAKTWRNSALAEVLLIVFVFAVGVPFIWRRYVALGAGGWYASAAPGGGPLSLAGLWLVFVSLPLFQFLLLRWYFRLAIWARFLWRVSRLDLDLEATHPDKAGGLGFLGQSLIAFVPIAAAHGILVAGMLADRILFTGAKLTDFEFEVLGVGVVLLLVFAGPLLVFAPLLGRVKRSGLRDYGALGQGYVRAFRSKWLSSPPPSGEPLLGTGDIQSLADLGNSFSVADQMRIVPVSVWGLLWFSIAYLAPILPLLLTMMPLEKLIEKLVGIVF